LETPVFLGKRGQASLEFVFIVVVMLLYMHTIILPSIDFAADSARDVKAVSEANFAAERLADTINYVASSSGDTAISLSVFVPSGATILCTGSSVESLVLLSMDATACIGDDAGPDDGKTCHKQHPVIREIFCSPAEGAEVYTYKISRIGGSLLVTVQ
jgi:uncharacterized protein (UPF0333 family)